MVQINYVDGTSETMEAREDTFYHSHFRYDAENQMFIIFDTDNEHDCMMIPREFVKSIRIVETE